MYLTWNRDFIAIFDADRQGIKEKKRYINVLGPDIESKIFTLNEINSSWKNFKTEDLLTDVEKLKITQMSFPKHTKENGYNKSKFNTAIQQLYIDGIKYKFNKRTISKIETIMKLIQNQIG